MSLENQLNKEEILKVARIIEHSDAYENEIRKERVVMFHKNVFFNFIFMYLGYLFFVHVPCLLKTEYFS